MALPWLFTQSAHQPLPHSEQIPCDGVEAWLAQRRQLPPWGFRGTAVRGAEAGGPGAAVDGRAAGAVAGADVAGFAAVGMAAEGGGGDGARAAGATAGGAAGPGAGARASDASATRKTVEQPLHRAFSPGTSSLSGGTRKALRHFGHRTVKLARDYSHLPRRIERRA
jgi:hypothetical protein